MGEQDIPLVIDVSFGIGILNLCNQQFARYHIDVHGQMLDTQISGHNPKIRNALPIQFQRVIQITVRVIVGQGVFGEWTIGISDSHIGSGINVILNQILKINRGCYIGI